MWQRLGKLHSTVKTSLLNVRAAGGKLKARFIYLRIIPDQSPFNLRPET